MQLPGTRLLVEKKMLNDKQLRAIHARYGRDTAMLPSVKESRSFQQAEIRAKIAEKYGGDVLDFKSVREAGSFEMAQEKAREELGKSYGVDFTSPQKAGEMKHQEIGGKSITQAEFDRIFKERLQQKVKQMKI